MVEESQDLSKQLRLPPDLPTPEEMDALISSEMCKLSVKEREKILEDVHGVGEVNEEDPSFISSCLDDLANHLLTRKQGTAYAIAESMSKQYVSDKDFYMMFLRAEEYDPSDAAERMIRFFELKKELFGVEKLVKDITLGDLSEDDMYSLESGCAQVSPRTDRAGRAILVFVQKIRRFKRIENLNRSSFYLFMSVLESPEVQRRGITAVHYHLDSEMGKSANERLRRALPLYLASIHMCLNDKNEHRKFQMTLKNSLSRHRMRYRLHFGSHAECVNELNSFGISLDDLPFDRTGQVLTHNHLEWIQSRRDLAANVNPTKVKSNSLDHDVQSRVEVSETTGLTPLATDVLLGRGKAIIDHPGNVRFRQVIDFYGQKYEAAGRLEKTCMAEVIVRLINSSGRFLKRDDVGAWEEVDEATARKKVAHAFRNRRLQLRL